MRSTCSTRSSSRCSTAAWIAPCWLACKVAAEGLSEVTGDPELDEVLGEIDLRVAVELAKAGIR